MVAKIHLKANYIFNMKDSMELRAKFANYYVIIAALGWQLA